MADNEDLDEFSLRRIFVQREQGAKHPADLDKDTKTKKKKKKKKKRFSHL
jgi:hypothetical protein